MIWPTESGDEDVVDEDEEEEDKGKGKKGKAKGKGGWCQCNYQLYTSNLLQCAIFGRTTIKVDCMIYLGCY